MARGGAGVCLAGGMRRRVLEVCRRIIGLDLRFPKEADEAAFKNKCRRKLRLLTSVALGIHFVFSCTTLPPLLAGEMEWEENPFEFHAADPRTMTWGVEAVLIAVDLCGMFTGAAEALLASHPFLDWEMIGMSLLLVHLCALPFSSRWFAPLMYGMQPERVSNQDPKDGELIMWQAIHAEVLVACLFCPLRTCVLWLGPLTGFTLFVVNTEVLGSAFPESKPRSNLALLVCMVTCYWCARTNERQRRGRWLALQQVRHGEEELDRRYRATTRILCRFCDCVVHVGPDLQVLDPEPRFAAMLLHSPDEPLVGRSICEFVYSQRDRYALVQALRGRASSQDEDGVVHCQMKDAHGREFAVDASFACFRDSCGEPHYLIGIAEVEERRPSAAAGAQQYSANLRQAAEHVTYATHEVLEVSNTTNTTENSGSSGKSRESLAVHALGPQDGDFQVDLFCRDAALPIAYASAAFAGEIGLHTYFRECLRECQELFEWVQVNLQSVRAGTYELPLYAQFGEVSVTDETGIVRPMFLTALFPSAAMLGGFSWEQMYADDAYRVSVLLQPTTPGALWSRAQTRHSRPPSEARSSRGHGTPGSSPRRLIQGSGSVSACLQAGADALRVRTAL